MCVCLNTIIYVCVDTWMTVYPYSHRLVRWHRVTLMKRAYNKTYSGICSCTLPLLLSREVSITTKPNTCQTIILCIYLIQRGQLSDGFASHRFCASRRGRQSFVLGWSRVWHCIEVGDASNVLSEGLLLIVCLYFLCPGM